MSFKDDFSAMQALWEKVKGRIDFVLSTLQNSKDVRGFLTPDYLFMGEMPHVEMDELTGATLIVCSMFRTTPPEVPREAYDALVHVPLRCFDHDNPESVVVEWKFYWDHRQELLAEKRRKLAE